ncbi:MAG TPA: hypothetical protein VGF84_16010 [Micromonosporaceae bacterium]
MPAKSSQPEPSSAPEPDETAADEVEVPMNRAERRAKGKSAGKPQVVGKITPSHVNNNHGPRSYANRRSG